MNCALKLVNEISLYYDARSEKHQNTVDVFLSFLSFQIESALIRHTVQPFTESDDTRCCDNTNCPPEDGHFNAPNMSGIVM